MRDLYLGCGLPGRESPGYNMARAVVNVLERHTSSVPGATITRYCASSVQTTRMVFHAIRSGEGDVFISAGVEIRPRVRLADLSTTLRDVGTRSFAPAAGAATPMEYAPPRRGTGTTPERTVTLPDIYMGHGPDR